MEKKSIMKDATRALVVSAASSLGAWGGLLAAGYIIYKLQETGKIKRY